MNSGNSTGSFAGGVTPFPKSQKFNAIGTPIRIKPSESFMSRLVLGHAKIGQSSVALKSNLSTAKTLVQIRKFNA